MQLLKGHRYGKPVWSLAFSPDGTKLASVARDNNTFLWDLNTGEGRAIIEGGSYTTAFSPDGRTVATGGGTSVYLWDAETDRWHALETGWDRGFGYEVAFAADGRTMIVVGHTIRVWDIVTGEQVPADDFDREGRCATNSLALTPDRKTMATGHGEPNRVRLWDVESRSLRDEFTGPTAVVSAVAFSPAGRYLAAAAGTTLWVWEVASKRLAVKHSINRLYCKDVAFTPDGRFLVFARNDATVSLWDTTTWAEVAAYDFGIGPMVSVACAPDGMRAAGGSAIGKIVVFDIDV